MPETSIVRAVPAPLSVVPATPEPQFRRLDVHSPDGFSTSVGKIGALGVVSFGYKEGNLPKASKFADAKHIHLKDPQGRASSLGQILESNGHRYLMIAFPHDNPAMFIQQSFGRWTASKREIYGDAEGNLYTIDAKDEKNPRHIKLAAKHEEHPEPRPGEACGWCAQYQRLKATCKVEYRIFFNLAAWDDESHGGMRVIFPDGLGVYALRTTSSHTVDEIVGYVEYVKQFTQGRIKGLPMRLEVVYREVSGPDGSKRTIPVGTVVSKPPDGVLELDSRTFQGYALAGLAEGANLMLPAPQALPGEPEDDVFDGPPSIEEPTEEEMRMLGVGAPVDWREFNQKWHFRTNNTRFDERVDGGRERRQEWLQRWPHAELNDLADVRGLSMADADRLIADLSEELTRPQRVMRPAPRYDVVHAEDDVPLEVLAARSTPSPARAPSVQTVDVPVRSRVTNLPPSTPSPSSAPPVPATPRPPAEPARVPAPSAPKTPPPAPAAQSKAQAPMVARNSGKAQAFQADYQHALALGIPEDGMKNIRLQNWPAPLAEVEEKHDRLKQLIAGFPPAPVASTAPDNEPEEVWEGEVPDDQDVDTREEALDNEGRLL